MGRTKVTLRSRSISKGRLSMYLDFYPKIRDPRTMKMIRVESLGMYVYAKPKNATQKTYNDTIWAQAEAIRALRVQSIINEEFGFLDKHKPNADFLLYFRELVSMNAPSWASAYKHFETFVQGSCTFGQLTADLCLQFRRYILQAPKFRHATQCLSTNTASRYFFIFRCVVFFAYRDKWLSENLTEFLNDIDTKPTHKEFLIPGELMRLSQTPCLQRVLKRASLFSCLTGLRFSDVLSLRWEQIVPNIDETGYNMRIHTEKTDAEATLPLSPDALELCGLRTEGKVFEGLSRTMLNVPMKRWLRAAGITKQITFHSFRHTYAVLQLASGTDIYTVSRMLTHKHVATTEIYLDLLEQTKLGTIDKIRIFKDPDLLAA